MNKTININLGGIFFHIDEIAYQKLKRYLDAIRRSLSDDPQGRDEIINDIEHRIGELLSERIKDERQVVNENDIDEITKIMGKPEDYLVDEEIFEDETGYYKTRTSNKKLYRDGEDKFLGGVSSGIAHYFGIDALWVRILWIVLVVAGFGSGIPIYILLWILIPEATTTAEKLQMKGEAVNISNIEKKIREEFNEVTSRVKDGVNDVTEKVKRSNFKKNVSSKSKSGLDEIIDVLSKIILTIFKVFGKFIGIILILIASLTLIGLIFGILSVGSIGILDFGHDWVDYPPFFFDSVIPSWLLILFTFIAAGIPFVVLFMLGLKILSSNINSFSTTTKLSLLGVWIIALLGLGFAGINFATQRAYDGVYNETQELPITSMDTLKIKMVGAENLSNRTELRREWGFETVYDNDQQKLYSTKLNVDIKTTEKLEAFVKVRKESQGNNRLNANNDAEAIEYQFNLNDKNLLLNGYFLSDFKNKFKDQLVDITVYLPINSVVYLDRSTRTFLDDVDNVQNIYDRDMPKHYYKMTENGLQCLDCDAAIFGDDYKKKHENFNLKIDEDGVEVKINAKNGKSDAKVKIDENGIIIQ
ncbi:phage shock protein C (PspC) family protein [Lutibacter agarilyticus]|uniref:Phage shock protein C (PspC) family protein n=1 Tax=Lutibacter agarilyticus TaxID=1109740 RepID=A0A238WET7_9FLAO|nr:PspC domain-containing protein [Lutibacter agarilyticus]SNR45075.1 phage shock protein C (PspC) family protein [Lutibacter agarilyticus]